MNSDQGQGQEWRVILPALHPAQERVKAQAARFNVLACGRRWGKTVFGLDRDSETVIEQGKPAAWFSPTYKMLEDVWRDATRAFREVIERVNVQQHRLEFITGGVLDMWSLDSPDGPRGRKYARAIIDEAAMVPNLEQTWQEVIRPTLADYAGDAWFCSTPRGVNFFHTAYLWGMDPGRPEWKSWQMPTSANPYIPRAEIEDMRRDMTERRYAQEVLAQFIEDAGGVFRGVDKCAVLVEQDMPAQHNGHLLVFGVDWAKENDYTVITALCGTCRKVVAWDRTNKVDYVYQRARLADLAARWHPSVITAEANSIGEPNIEMLTREGLPVRRFETTSTTKPPLIEALALAIERQDVLVPKEYAGELRAYEMTRNKNTGHPTYSAPVGLHDDCVMSLALAWHAATAGVLTGRLMY